MLLKDALLLMTAWLAGIVGLFDVGSLVHVLLLAGLMLLPIGMLKARDAAAAARTNSRPSDR